MVKLLDFVDREAFLEASDNPFALVTRAHLATMQTRQDAASRHDGKTRLIRELYQRGMSQEDVLQLFHIIDWMMDLPKALERLFKQEAELLEQEKNMPYLTSVERLGRRDEQEKMLTILLEHKFGSPLPAELKRRLEDATDSVQLEQWFRQALDATSLEEYQRQLQKSTNP